MSPGDDTRRSNVVRPEADATVVLIRRDVEVASWVLPRSERRDLTVVDRLARLQLAALRAGCRIELRDVRAELAGLLNLVGLTPLMTSSAALPLDPLDGSGIFRQTECCEQIGVEEVVMPDDPVA